jgi:uncharacterized RDD family membrane protein YckC
MHDDTRNDSLSQQEGVAKLKTRSIAGEVSRRLSAHAIGGMKTRLVHLSGRNELFTDKVFAGLAAVIVIGLVVEHVVFQALARVTARRWGMER